MKIVIFDDSAIQVSFLNKQITGHLISEYPNLVFSISGFSNTSEFKTYYLENDAEIFFIDISTADNEKYGIEAASEIRQRHPQCHIAFCTSHADLISYAFDNLIKPSQYIIKPVGQNILSKLLDDIIIEKNSVKSKLCLKGVKQDWFVEVADILYIEKSDRHCIIHSINKILESSCTLKELKELLPESFFYADKGIIVNTAHISGISRGKNQLTLKNSETIYFSRSAKKILSEMFHKVAVW